MLCFIFVMFACILPSYALEGNGTKIRNMTACSDPKAGKIGDEFYECFKVKVNNSLKDEKLKCSTPLRKILIGYVKVSKKTCYNDTTRSDNDSQEFHDLIEFSLKNGNFKAFVETGGVECVKAIKNNITRCVVREVGNITGAHNIYSTLWKKTKLTIDVKSCQETQKIKMCTLKAMRSKINQKCKDKIDHLMYVSSLFDYMLERCNKMVPKWVENEQTPEEGMVTRRFKTTETGDSATHIMLAVLLTLVILGFLYVLFRDRRTTNAHWKSPVEHFAMKERPLVNNESCHEH